MFKIFLKIEHLFRRLFTPKLKSFNDRLEIIKRESNNA